MWKFYVHHCVLFVRSAARRHRSGLFQSGRSMVKKNQKKLCVACYTTLQATTETCDPLPFEREEWRTCTSRGVRRCLLQCNSIISRFMTLTILFHSILTTFSTLAVPSVTGASLITVIILLTALNIPAEAASLLFALEWFL